MKHNLMEKYVLALALNLGIASAAFGAPLFWAVNQFSTIQQLNGDTGQVVQQFAIPGGYFGASIAVDGNTGYLTVLGDPNVRKVDMTLHTDLGVAFNNGLGSGLTNSITIDANHHIWMAGGNSDPLLEFTTAGALVSSHTFPTSAFAFRDGLVVVGNHAVGNRGDQVSPYDQYLIPGGNGALTYSAQPFIDTTLLGPGFENGFNGIAFNGLNYYASNEQLHRVYKFDTAGAFVSFANLDVNSRYENWVFAAQDIVVDPNAIPEPTSLLLFGLGFLSLFVGRRSKK